MTGPSKEAASMFSGVEMMVLIVRRDQELRERSRPEKMRSLETHQVGKSIPVKMHYGQADGSKAEKRNGRN